MAITVGYSAGSSCPPAMGGLVEFYFVNKSAYDTITASGLAVTDMTAAVTGAGFEKFVGVIESMNFVEDLQRGDNRSDNNNIQIVFNTPALSATDLGTLNALRTECRLYCIARIPNGTFYLFGYDPNLGDEAFVEFQGMNHNSGSARTDSHIYTWTFVSKQTVPAYLITGLSSESATTAAQIAAALVSPA